MNISDIFAAIDKADPADKLATAEQALADYADDDKELIAPDVMEYAALQQDA